MTTKTFYNNYKNFFAMTLQKVKHKKTHPKMYIFCESCTLSKNLVSFLSLVKFLPVTCWKAAGERISWWAVVTAYSFLLLCHQHPRSTLNYYSRNKCDSKSGPVCVCTHTHTHAHFKQKTENWGDLITANIIYWQGISIYLIGSKLFKFANGRWVTYLAEDRKLHCKWQKWRDMIIKTANRLYRIYEKLSILE